MQKIILGAEQKEHYSNLVQKLINAYLKTFEDRFEKRKGLDNLCLIALQEKLKQDNKNLATILSVAQDKTLFPLVKEAILLTVREEAKQDDGMQGLAEIIAWGYQQNTATYFSKLTHLSVKDLNGIELKALAEALKISKTTSLDLSQFKLHEYTKFQLANLRYLVSLANIKSLDLSDNELGKIIIESELSREVGCVRWQEICRMIAVPHVNEINLAFNLLYLLKDTHLEALAEAVKGKKVDLNLHGNDLSKLSGKAMHAFYKMLEGSAFGSFDISKNFVGNLTPDDIEKRHWKGANVVVSSTKTTEKTNWKNIIPIIKYANPTILRIDSNGLHKLNADEWNQLYFILKESSIVSLDLSDNQLFTLGMGPWGYSPTEEWQILLRIIREVKLSTLIISDNGFESLPTKAFEELCQALRVSTIKELVWHQILTCSGEEWSIFLKSIQDSSITDVNVYLGYEDDEDEELKRLRELHEICVHNEKIRIVKEEKLTDLIRFHFFNIWQTEKVLVNKNSDNSNSIHSVTISYNLGNGKDYLDISEEESNVLFGFNK